MMRGSHAAMGCIVSRAQPSARLSHQVLTAAQPRAAALYRATIEVVRDVAGTDIRLLRMKAHDALIEGAKPPAPSPPLEAFRYAAGQWVDFHIPGVDAVGGYSIISAPSRMPDSISRMLDSPQLPFFDLAVKKARCHRRCIPRAFVTLRTGPASSRCVDSQ